MSSKPKKSVLYFEENVTENQAELITIGEMGKTTIFNEFNVLLEDPRSVISFYLIVIQSIFEDLKRSEKTNSSLRIIIANRLEVGFTTTFDIPENEDIEKTGNFMIYMKHIENDSLTEIDKSSTSSVERCTQWLEANNTVDTDEIGKIVIIAKEKLSTLINMELAQPKIILPLFCTIHEKLVQYLKIARAEEDVFEYIINVGGYFDAYCRLMEDGVEVSFKPAVYSKVKMKDDGSATAIHE